MTEPVQSVGDRSSVSNREMLAELLRERARRPRRLPASPAQRRLWFIDRMDPSNPMYHVWSTLHFEYAVETSVMERAIQAVVQRHASLRTTFPPTDAEPQQEIVAELAVPLREISFEEKVDSEAACHHFVVEEVARPIDLSQGPLFRPCLLKVGRSDHRLLITIHHIVCDMWSMRTFFREVVAAYSAYLAGDEPDFQRLRIQYHDYSQWQGRLCETGGLTDDLDYWQSKLEGVSTGTELPTDRPRGAVQTFRGRRFVRPLDRDVCRGVDDVCRKLKTTRFTVLLAAFKGLLQRYTSSEDIVIGTAVANRDRPEVQNLIGFLLNMLVLRTDASGDPTFSELAGRVAKTTLDACEHQALPFEDLVQHLVADRDPARSPLFQLAFDLRDMSFASPPAPHTRLTALEPEIGTSMYDLHLTVEQTKGEPTSDGLVGYWEYNSDLFDEQTIESLARHYQSLLAHACRDPSKPLSRLEMFSPTERDKILNEWNDGQLSFDDETTIHHLIDRTASRRPHAVAATLNDESYTYEELDRSSNRLAHDLIARGVKPGTLVAIAGARSLSTLVGIFGVLKAGGAYVPLDVSYPEQRLEFMLRDSGAPLLLCLKTDVERMPCGEVGLVYLDDYVAVADDEVVAAPRVDVGPDDLAYVIYTSGSTGRPKGVMIEHRGLCHLAQAQQSALCLDETSRVLQFAPFSFDASVWEIFATLLAGGTLCLADQQDLLPGPDLARLLRAQRVTTITMPPSVLEVLSERGLPDLKTVVSAGEACSAELVRRWGPGRRFINAYGPTETTVCASLAVCDPNDPVAPTIGRPIGNLEIYLLNDELVPVAVGVAGQLYVAGVGLARGYHGRPDLTSERFIRHPFKDDPSARLYQTGDLARYRSDGSIEYLGRVDHQVKIRGYRIETGEVEAILKEHPAIEAAVVIARGQEAGAARLVAYLVTQLDKPPAESELEAHLRRKVPPFMVPSDFVVLDELPLSPSGKIDREALPEPKRARPASATASRPATKLERTIADIWKEVLEVSHIDVERNFFDLGGHSLKVAQVHNRLDGLLEQKIAIVDLFRFPTVRSLALYLSEAGNGETNDSRSQRARPLKNKNRLKQLSKRIKKSNAAEEKE